MQYNDTVIPLWKSKAYCTLLYSTTALQHSLCVTVHSDSEHQQHLVKRNQPRTKVPDSDDTVHPTHPAVSGMLSNISISVQ
jgi:hypothetical protein